MLKVWRKNPNLYIFFCWCHVFLRGSLQLKLRLAAKARIMRMVKAKSKRRDLEVPEWVKAEWGKGNKNQIADLLCSANFDKDQTYYIYIYLFNAWACLSSPKLSVSYLCIMHVFKYNIQCNIYIYIYLYTFFLGFYYACVSSQCSQHWFSCHQPRRSTQEAFLNSLHVVVTKKKKVVSVEVEEGWFSESELRDEVGWSQPLPYNSSIYISQHFNHTCSLNITICHGPGPRSTVQRPIVWACRRPMSGAFATHTSVKYYSYALLQSLYECSTLDIPRDSTFWEGMLFYCPHHISDAERTSTTTRRSTG